MQHVVRWALHVIPGAQHASVSLAHRRRGITSAAVTGEVAGRFDNLQQQVGQGPGLEAMYERKTVRVHDLRQDGRWPVLARECSEVGVRSVLGLQLFVHAQDLGALTVVSDQVDAFEDAAEHQGLLVATYAAVALAHAVHVEGLTRANANRTVIGQAEGILMERLKVDPEVASAMLARISQTTNRRLHQVADELVTTGDIPTAPDRPWAGLL